MPLHMPFLDRSSSKLIIKSIFNISERVPKLLVFKLQDKKKYLELKFKYVISIM